MKNIIKSKYVRIILSLFVVGFIFGCVYILFISSDDKEYINNYLNEYFNMLPKHKSTYKELINIIFNNFLLLCILLTSSIIILFFPLIVVVNMYLGFKIGFLLSSLYMVFKFKGLYYLLLLIFPIYLIKVLIFLVFLIYNYKYSKLIFNYFKNSSNINIRNMIIKYIKLFIIFTIFIIIISVLEVYVSPLIINSLMI